MNVIKFTIISENSGLSDKKSTDKKPEEKKPAEKK